MTGKGIFIAVALAATVVGFTTPVPIEFLIFALTLTGVACFHHHNMWFAAAGAAAITGFKLYTGFDMIHHVGHEWVIITNLFCLLTGFALLSRHFEDTKIPERMPDWLPDGWTGGLVLLIMVYFMSGFLDNIAAALIGVTIAGVVFKKKLHIGFLAAIVAASNGGGAGSVIGDTTTTMMWLDGVSPIWVLPAFIASASALLVSGTIAARQQHKFNPITKDAPEGIKIDFGRLGVVAMVLVAAVAANIAVNLKAPELGDRFPVIGVVVWLALLLTAPFRKPHWEDVGPAGKGAVFLLLLVLAASMLPVEKLPEASLITAFFLGILSSVFDNIPLTKMALKQGGYDWSVLAYAVGYGGSMIWFGSSAGVAVCNRYPEAKNVVPWLKNGWHVPVSYVVGFAAMAFFWGWNPHPTHKPQASVDGVAEVVSSH